MKKIIRLKVLTLFICASLFLTNNKAFGQTDSTQFKPFNVAVSKFTVNDFNEWKRMYDKDTTIRKSNGMNAIAVANSIYNSNTVITAYVINDIEKVKEYVGSKEFQEKAKKAGVINHQTFDFIQVVRFNPPKFRLDFLEYSIKVKDFDQWLKAYDTEVASQRLEYGLIDEVIARGIDDKNLVHLVFLISDIEKAKKMMSSKKIKKRMREQGVTVMPTFEYYTR